MGPTAIHEFWNRVCSHIRHPNLFAYRTRSARTLAGRRATQKHWHPRGARNSSSGATRGGRARRLLANSDGDQAIKTERVAQVGQERCSSGLLAAHLAEARSRTARLPKRPRVFFEEWDDPLISGIGWVSELVEIAGGIDIFADHAGRGAAKDRVVSIDEVVAQEPDLIIGSWCGKKFRPERVMARPGFDRTPAVQHQDVYEIKSSLILQPGPAALTDGLAALEKIIERWAKTRCDGTI